MRDVKHTLKYILKRLLLMVFTFLVIFVICFTLIRMLPVNEAAGLGKDADIIRIQLVAQGRMKVVNGQYVYTPIIEQLGHYIKNLFFPGVDPSTGFEKIKVEVYYDGTIEEWKQIEKGRNETKTVEDWYGYYYHNSDRYETYNQHYSWRNKTEIPIIHCTDGDYLDKEE